MVLLHVHCIFVGDGDGDGDGSILLGIVLKKVGPFSFFIISFFLLFV